MQRIIDQIIKFLLWVSSFGKKDVNAVDSYPKNNSPVYQDPNYTIRRPHVARVELVTSEPNNIHHFKDKLEIKICIRHEQAMKRACLSVVIVNQLQARVVHAWAFYPDHIYGTQPGETLMRCRFPSLKLSPGHYHLQTYLAETPGGDEYERLDNICPFEIINPGDARPTTSESVYQEDCLWQVETIH